MRHANIAWFEIPVDNLNRAITFYSVLLETKIEVENIMNRRYGMIKKQDVGVGGVLVEKNCVRNEGVLLFFYVDVLSDSIAKAEEFGGKVITPKTIMKQVDQTGKHIIAANLIDERTGYFAEIEDSEGNKLALYSHY